jgi:hypothetical protein
MFLAREMSDSLKRSSVILTNVATFPTYHFQARRILLLKTESEAPCFHRRLAEGKHKPPDDSKVFAFHERLVLPPSNTFSNVILLSTGICPGLTQDKRQESMPLPRT